MARQKAVRVDEWEKVIQEIKARLAIASRTANAGPLPQNSEGNQAGPKPGTTAVMERK